MVAYNLIQCGLSPSTTPAAPLSLRFATQ